MNRRKFLQMSAVAATAKPQHAGDLQAPVSAQEHIDFVRPFADGRSGWRRRRSGRKDAHCGAVCEEHDVDYIFGLARYCRLQEMLSPAFH